MPTPTVNIVGTPGQASTSSTVSCTLSSVPAGDMIVVSVNGGSTTSQGVFIVWKVTATGLTFVNRNSLYIPGGPGSASREGTEMWWAMAPSGFSGTITATFEASAGANTPKTIDDSTIHPFSVTNGGGWTGSTFTASHASGTSSAMNSSPFSAPSSSLAIVNGATDETASFTTPVSGWTNISTASNSGGFAFQNSAVQRQTGPLSGATVGWTNTGTWWVLVADAIIYVPPVTASSQAQLINA